MQGIEDHLAETLRDAFGGRPTINSARASKLLNINEKTLRKHVRRGTIAFRQTGLGKFRARREFALQDLLDFYIRARRRLEPAATVTYVRKGSQIGFLAGHAARRAARKERSHDASD